MNLIQIRTILVLSCIVLSSHMAVAQPRKLTVVADHGGTSAMTYYESLGLTSAAPDKFSSFPEQTAPATGSGRPVSLSGSNRSSNGSVTNMPVTSIHLSPGLVSRRAATSSSLSAAMQPFFVVGDDPLSRRWLRERYDVLKKLNAVGLVVNVDSQEALQALQKLVPDLTLSAVPGDDLAVKLQLKHYPVLITASGIEQ